MEIFFNKIHSKLDNNFQNQQIKKSKVKSLRTSGECCEKSRVRGDPVAEKLFNCD